MSEGMKKVVVLFKSGSKVEINCSYFKVQKAGGEFVGYEIKGVIDNLPLFINFDDVDLIYQILDNEVSG